PELHGERREHEPNGEERCVEGPAADPEIEDSPECWQSREGQEPDQIHVPPHARAPEQPRLSLFRLRSFDGRPGGVLRLRLRLSLSGVLGVLRFQRFERPSGTLGVFGALRDRRGPLLLLALLRPLVLVLGLQRLDLRVALGQLARERFGPRPRRLAVVAEADRGPVYLSSLSSGAAGRRR